jgi:integrase/recombinase XerC
MTSSAQTGAQFVGFLEAWLESLSSAGRSPITVECYRRDLGAFKRIACRLRNRGNIDMKLVGQEQLDLIVSAWKAEAASTQTIARRFSALRGFARFLIATGRTDCARLLTAKVAESERTRRPLLSEQEKAALLSREHVDACDWTAMRDLAMFSLEAEAALASVEVAALNREDLNDDSISIRRTCFSPRTAPIASRSRRMIDDYLHIVPYAIKLNGPLFVNERGTRISVRTIQTRFRRHMRRIGLAGERGPGILRRGFGRNLAVQGHGPTAIAEALGIRPLSALRLFESEE